jgi:hypothetical protein
MERELWPAIESECASRRNMQVNNKKKALQKRALKKMSATSLYGREEATEARRCITEKRSPRD